MLIAAMLVNLSGCEKKSSDTADTKAKAENIIIKPTIPYSERLFIYNNGLEIEYKQLDTEDESFVRSHTYYPVISGLKNKTVQNKLNTEIPAVLKEMLTELQVKYPEGQEPIKKYEHKSTYAHISYNHNNVLFIIYNANINAVFDKGNHTPIYSCKGIGYDLNTGYKIELSDLFKPGIDYKSKINAYISQYIIENNFDDYSSEMMTKPFQGIRENQSFSLAFEGLMIILDEKNDEFAYNGYTNTIMIPLEHFGDDLYIFDRYYDEGTNIYEKSKLTKKLFPNKIKFIPKDNTEQGSEKWHVSIMKGDFINIPDKSVEEKIAGMLETTFDTEEFIKEAEEFVSKNKDVGYYGGFIHNIEVPINAGGYLSVFSLDEIYRRDSHKQHIKVFNYDFNRSREMKFRDLFINDINLEAIIKTHIMEMNLPVSNETIDEEIKKIIDSNEFYFSEYDVRFHFSPEGVKLDPYQEWIWMNFDKFGLENISIFN